LTKLWFKRWHVRLWQCACKLGWQLQKPIKNPNNL
jgi:hypothetical protein